MSAVNDANETADANGRPIDRCLETWHRFLKRTPGVELEELLHPDCVFYSPVVFTPQKGREITAMYLRAATQVLGEKPATDTDQSSMSSRSADPKTFGYVREIRDGNQAMLEFESYAGGKYINGVDIITCDDDGIITEFKVMIRPLQAINMVHQQMGTMLEKLGG